MIRRQIPLAIAAVLTVAAAAPAHADWSFAKWGMSPDQLMRAAGGKARPVMGGPGDRVMDMDHRASGGPFTFEGRNYLANFYFDLDGGRGLRVVRLQALDQSQCDAIDAELTKRYGASSNAHHGEWKDAKTGNKVFFSKSYKVMPGMACYLSYSGL